MVDDLDQTLRIQRQSMTEPAAASYGNADWGRAPLDARFHENSKLTPATAGDQERSIGRFLADAGSGAVEGRQLGYPFHEAVDLPSGEPPEASLASVLDRRTSDLERATTPVTSERLGQLLDTAVGAGERRDATAPDRPADGALSRRSYPSAGRLYPIEWYVLVRSVPGLDPGAYYYAPERHLLRVLARFEDSSRFDDAFRGDARVESADAAVLASNVGARVRAKYGARGYRYALFEAGHGAQNLQLVATALGLGATPFGDFYDDRANDLLGLDGVDAGVVYAVLLAGANGDRAPGGGTDA
ncbi:SagB family peptide dehydrogenase [Halomicrobium salinisoli]|uniref:SagB family peptide dehydrogenase n=1 Tax=Halomicrobium salinisoli TaxID=2878391 RepID=UPI001CEFE239|nr:SagB family peptide dehydrogenase [Halomicrobium salinisoli]